LIVTLNVIVDRIDGELRSKDAVAEACITELAGATVLVDGTKYEIVDVEQA
jgi:hypothetical protein